MIAHLNLEERLNVLTHFLGVLGSCLGGYWLFTHLPPLPERVIWGVYIYLFSLLFLFSASTIYHALPERYHHFWQRVDHIGIFILIAGTYTPITLSTLYEGSGPYFLVAVWSIALFGLVYKLFFINRYRLFSVLLYLAMGWLVIFDIQTVFETFNTNALKALVVGGISYTVGVFFYRWDRLFLNHAIWHVFVLGGALSHFFMVFYLLVE